MRHDKKVSGGEIKFVLARKIGHVQFGCRVPAALIEQALNPQLLGAAKRGGDGSTLN